jgi:PmbA protein
MSSPDLTDIAESVLARGADGEQVEVVVGRSTGTEIRVYEGEVEKLTTAESAGVGVRIIRDGRQGFAYAGSLDPSVVAEVLDEARDNAAFGDVDDANGVAEPDGQPYADLQLFRPGLASVPTSAKIDLALQLERAVRSADPRIAGMEACDYEDGTSEAIVATSTGIRASSRETYAYLSADALATDGDETQTGYWFDIGREAADLDVEACAAEVARRATQLLGATKPASSRVTVVLDPFVTAQFLDILGFALSAENVLKGRSLFAERVGEEVASPLVTLIEDPTDTAAMTATAADGEGLATRRTPLLAAGRLEGFLHDSYTARRLGTASTGSAVRGFSSTPHVGTRALAITPGAVSPADLVAGIDDGVLVRGVSGLHSGVNPISGDFSTGAEGLRIAGGALGEPVKEFTIASTLQRMLQDVQAVGSDLTWLPMSAAGVTLVIGDVTVSGR